MGMRAIFRAPRFADAESTRIATVLAPLLTISTIASVIITLSAFAVEWMLPAQIVMLFVMTAVFGFGRWLVQVGRLHLAAWLLTGMGFFASTSSLFFDATTSTYAIAYAVTIAIGGLTLGRRRSVGFAVAASLLIIAAHVLQQTELVTLRSPPEAHGVIVMQVVCLLLLGGVMVWSNRALTVALTQIQRQESAARELEQGLYKAQRMESIGRLAGGIAHDFNNLLTVALGNAAYLKASVDLEGEEKEAVNAILKACDGGANLTKQLLTFGRKRVVARETLDPADVVADFELVLDYMAGKHAELQIDCTPGRGAIECDPGQLQHALANLVINAGQAVADGGTVEISTSGETLEAERPGSHGTIPAGEYVVIRVRDTGTGMSSKTISAAFEPFFTTRYEGGGSGLGLAVVHGVVHQNGGFAEIESDGETGTTFSLWFPRAAAEVGWRPATGSHAIPTRLDDIRVLLVDDDDDARRSIGLLLEEAGAEVCSHRSGADALAELGRDPDGFALALVDVIMPEMPGPQLAHALRERGFGRPIVFLTGYADPELLRDEIDRAATILYKPIRGADLTRALANTLADAAEGPDQLEEHSGHDPT
jgi:signal transduction histidine kinase/CheY-like chemotaxis protein